MRYNYLLLSILTLIVFSSLASSTLGTFKQNDCVQIRTILNTTGVTLSTLSYPNNTLIAYGVPMTATGKTFNYTTCETSALGTYTYDYNDTDGNVYVNDFLITPSGYDINNSEIFLIILGVGVILILSIFFFILSYIMKMPQIKILFMGLSAITLILAVGLMTSQASVFLYKFASYSSVYSAFYVFILILASAAAIALVVWFIYYAFTAFNKSRGTFPED